MPKRNPLRPFTEDERIYLEKLQRSRLAAQQHVERATILLCYALNEPVAALDHKASDEDYCKIIMGVNIIAHP